jgi:DNA-binding response OmpR family regulator
MRLISQMLDLSKLESRKLPLRVAPGDLAGELGTIVAAFADLAENQRISLRLEGSGGGTAAPAYFDRDVLEKIVNNLLANACKVTPPGGTITVTLDRCPQPSAGGSDVEVSEIVISDTGSGISAEHLPHVFDRFYQAGSIRIREGFGIGLALVKELVELHRGVVTVASEAGRGTTFVVRLPVGRRHFRADEIVGAPAATPVASEDLPTQMPPAVQAVVAAGPPERRLETTVLVVEDHKELRGFLREQLEPHYRVVEAGDGSAGLERARSFLPGLVLSDVMMDGMDGYELCRALKTDMRTSHIPVVLLTARAGREDHMLGLERGADCFMIKPFEPRELLAQISNLVEQRRLLRHRFSGSVILKPSEMAVVSADEVFLDRILTVVEAHLEDPEFDVEQLGQAVGLSRSQLHRKVRSLTQQPPTILIRSIRLQRSAALLAGRAGGVAEIAYSVGFSSQSYFAKCFRQQFGCSPKEYRDARHAAADGSPSADV